MKFIFPKKLHKKQVITGIVTGVFLLLWVLLQVFRAHAVAGLSDLQGAKRFAPEGGYAQIACYFADTAGVTADRHREFSFLVEEALTKNAIEANPGARLFVDCYTVNGRLTISHGGKSVEAEAIGTGGDFFFVHPVELVSGMYYSADALTPDQVLIDETVAWQLFGGMDIAGQTVTIGGQMHVVRGVVKSADGRMRQAAGAEGALVYLPASSLAQNGQLRSEEALIGCYEVVMPDPVRDFAITQIREVFKGQEGQVEIVNDTTRFHNLPLLKVLRGFGTRSMTDIALRYPYWENIARGTEDILVIVMVLQALCLAVPIAIGVFLIVKSYRHKKWTAKGIFDALGDRIYETQSVLRQKKES